MDEKIGMELASDMLGMEITEVDELVVSAVGEICNMIMGNACSSFGSDKLIDIRRPPS
jgi:CheY-specific phosphatase CheX